MVRSKGLLADARSGNVAGRAARCAGSVARALSVASFVATIAGAETAHAEPGSVEAEYAKAGRAEVGQVALAPIEVAIAEPAPASSVVVPPSKVDGAPIAPSSAEPLPPADVVAPAPATARLERPETAPTSPAPTTPADLPLDVPVGSTGTSASLPPAPPPSLPEARSPRQEGLLGPARVGVLAGVGLSTRPVSLLAVARFYRTLSIGAEYKLLPTTSISDATVRAYAVGGELRWFPTGGAFFVGAAAGYQSMSIAAERQGVPGSFDVSSLYVTPRVGCLWTFDFGLALGVDVGVTVPVAADVAVNTPVAIPAVEDTARTLGKLPLPEISLLRVGMTL